MFRPSLLFAALTVAASAVGAQQSLTAAQEQAVDAIFAPMTRGVVPGCAVAIFRDGRTVFARGYGHADLTHRVPITPETPFTIGSVTKQFTAAAIYRLSLEGKLGLDDDVRRYVPELRDYGTPVTIRQMIHHTSGLRDFWALVGLAGMRYDDGYRAEDVLALASRQRALNFPPGTSYAYSNTSYVLLGMIVQRVTGATLRQYADSVFFKPLGMTKTLYLDDHTEIVPGRAAAYSPRRDGWSLNVWANDLVGQGGMVTTLEDLRRWDENSYTGAVGGERFVRGLEQPGKLVNDSALTYAFGLEVDRWRGQRVVSHTGASGGYRAALTRFPDLHTSVALLCNVSTANSGQLANRVALAAFGDKFAPAPAAVTPSAPGAAAPSSADATSIPVARRAAVAARWYSDELDATWELRESDGELQLVVPRNPTRAVRAGPNAALVVPGLTLSFGSGDRPATMTVAAGRASGITFRRVE